MTPLSFIMKAHQSLTYVPTYGAMMLPNRAHIEELPTPVVRSTVGNTSAEYTYTMANEAEMQNLPIMAHVTIGQSRV